jgi:glycerol-3-phosphate acyltransferase PlsX
MGGDSSPLELFEGILEALNFLGKRDRIYALATPAIIKKFLPLSNSSQLELIAVSEFIKMSENPVHAARKKKSSMAVGISLLHEKKVDAFISSGNTGALVLNARLRLNLLPNIKTPALLALLPTEKGPMAVLDVGSIVTATPESLRAYAQMGSTFMERYFHASKPRIGLLNIGSESGKGTQIHQKTYKLLDEFFGKDFKGNIEGKEAFQGIVDVLVTDGFTGNVFLKTAEGVSAFLIKLLKKKLNNLPEKISQFSPDEYPGAILCGVEGIVIKCHGDSKSKSMFHSIMGVRNLIRTKRHCSKDTN